MRSVNSMAPYFFSHDRPFYGSGEIPKLISMLSIKAIKRIVRYIDICFFMVNNVGYHFC